MSNHAFSSDSNPVHNWHYTDASAPRHDAGLFVDPAVSVIPDARIEQFMDLASDWLQHQVRSFMPFDLWEAASNGERLNEAALWIDRQKVTTFIFVDRATNILVCTLFLNGKEVARTDENSVPRY